MRARASWTYLAVAVAVVLVGRALPGELATMLVYDAIGVSAVVAIVVAVRRHRPRDASAWQLIAAGIALLTAGDIVWDVAVPLPERWSEAVANALYIGAYAPLILGLLRLARARTHGRDGDALADSAIIVAAALLPAWQFLIEPALDAGPLTPDTAAAVLYPLLDMVLVGALARVVFGRVVPSPAVVFLVAGVAVTLVGDVAYLHLLSSGVEPPWLGALWPVSYILFGASALQPSMRALTEPRSQPRRPGLALARIALLASALVVGPAVLLTEYLDGKTVDARVFGPVSALVAVIVMWRLVQTALEADKAVRAVQDSEVRFRSLVQHAGDVIFVVEPDGRLRYVSPAVGEVLGGTPDDFVGTHYLEHTHPDDVDAVTAGLLDVLSGPSRPYIAQARARHRDGGWRWVEAICTNRLDEPGVRGIVVNLRDMTDRKRVEALMAGEARALAMIARSDDLGEILAEVALTVEDQLGEGRCSIRVYDAENGSLRSAVAPSLPDEYVHQLDEIYRASAIVNQLSAHRQPVTLIDQLDSPIEGVREVALAHDLRYLWVVPIVAVGTDHLLGTFAVYSPTNRQPDEASLAAAERGRALAAIAIDRAAAEDRLEHQALHDPLTGLPNRGLAVDRLSQALRRLDRSDSAVAVLFLDLDRFKVINDSLGHQIGDELLRAVGDRLAVALRPEDTVARFGGDEFVVICERVDGDGEAQLLAQRVARSLAEPFPLTSGGEAVVTASIGIALSRSRSDRAESLLRDADVAMYRAKDHGRARYEVFDRTMHTQAVVRLLTERALRRAVDNDELRLYFQPQIDLETGAVVAVEGLVRWEHLLRGLVSPGEFIPVAEETGLIVPIGEWVLGAACEQAAQWRRAGVGPDGALGVSVNLSGRQLNHPGLHEQIRRQLAEHQIEPNALCLEVTESVFVDDAESAGAALAGLKSLGVRLAIDDFGTGYSSLTYLKRFPFDELKIDASFVGGLGLSAEDDAIVAATIDMAHALGMVVAAEGVETEAHLARLRELGCDLAQGFHIAPPAPADELAMLALAASRQSA